MTSERLSLQSVEDAALDRLVERGLQLRLYLGPLVLLSTIAFLAWDATPWRRTLLLTLVGIAASRLAWEAWRARQRGFHRERLSALIPVPATVLVFVVATTGGVDSPLAVMLPLITVLLAMFLHPRVGTVFATLVTLTAWVLAWLAWTGGISTLMPEAFGGGARASNGALLVTRASVLTVALTLGALLGGVMRRAFQSAIQRALDARDELLVVHQESTRTLTTLAAEIAHELKNPLASVKGLAALVDRDAEGKDKERLTVLRREVDRMQEILESFLTFSRPLVPLSVSPVKMKDLVEQVLAIHEGVAHERGLEFRLDATEVTVQGDSRKLTQVLINLVQNALDVTPALGAVDVVVRGAPQGGALVLISDRGPGVANLERAFEPGVTTKAHGSGLGLTVARLVARQHGGEVTLTAREGGGTTATLSLPSSAGIQP